MKKGSFFIVILLILSILGGCAKQNEEAAPPLSESVQSSAEPAYSEIQVAPASAATQEIHVTDQAGREVVLAKKAEKIVSCYYISSSLLIALGCKDRVVGIEMKADTRELYKKAAPGFLELPAVGSGKGVNVEEIAALSPDLVVLPYKLKDSVEQLEELNIPTLVIDPETMSGFQETIMLLSRLTGTPERGDQLINYIDAALDMARVKTEGLAVKPKVYLSSGGDYLRTCTSKMVQNDMIQIAGGENVSKDLTDGYWQTVSPEQLMTWNPDTWLYVSYAEYTKDDILKDSRLQNVAAVKSGNVFEFPSVLEAWDYPTPSCALGVLWLLQKFHPNLYSKEEFQLEAESFYRTFYDIEITTEELGL